MLHVAARFGHSELVTLLLQRGALKDLETRCKCQKSQAPEWDPGYTPLEYTCYGPSEACDSGSKQQSVPIESVLRVIETLVDAGAERSRAAFKNAVLSGFGVEVLRPLSDKGAVDICVPEEYDKGPEEFHWEGREYGSKECIADERATFLHMASVESNAATVRGLLELGADIHACDTLGRQPLHWAVSRFQRYWPLFGPDDVSAKLEVLQEMSAKVEVLLQSGANPGRQDRFRRTPLHYAALQMHTRLFEPLLRHGGSLTVTDEDGRSPLHLLADGQSYLIDNGRADWFDSAEELDVSGREFATVLKPYSTDIDQKDALGNTALHLAAGRAYASVLELLLALGADPNIANPQGQTALHLACDQQSRTWYDIIGPAGGPEPWENETDRRHKRMRTLLIDAGVDQSIRDAQGRTAAEIEREEASRISQMRQKCVDDFPERKKGWSWETLAEEYESRHQSPSDWIMYR
ncbi:uncharacterized protein E0L32_000341 [Thyridium curvatum]|uniref:protein S-acyltransferase n=1 Tax=Thyridium curvatum TaxID=1093900 RepID=A0A507B863_9PEZI|nr:uncharacterized protein E0L32_000341 [Thyridium curvatum]TPX16007.1 hypothetical protein E0L32_000341 [Thyridium curvatum]